MYELKDNDIVREIKCDNNFAYVLADNSKFVNTDYKVLQSQSNDIFIKAMRMMYNGKIEIFYMTDDYRPMSTMFNSITSDILMTVIANLFNAITEVKNNGFLKCQNIDISWDKIYVNPNTLKVKLVYIPVDYRIFDSYAEFESELRAGLIKLIGKVIVSLDSRMEKFLLDLSNSSLSLSELYMRTKGENTSYVGKHEFSEQITSVSGLNNTSDDYDTKGRNEKNVHLVSEYPKLVAMNAPEYFEILLDKPSMLLGKKQGAVDAVIPFNNMISRIHCRVMCVDGKYLIRDERSANGTYLNGYRLETNKAYPINRGDVVRLADSDFQVI